MSLFKGYFSLLTQKEFYRAGSLKKAALYDITHLIF
jgi:hypothetical protein